MQAMFGHLVNTLNNSTKTQSQKAKNQEIPPKLNTFFGQTFQKGGRFFLKILACILHLICKIGPAKYVDA